MTKRARIQADPEEAQRKVPDASYIRRIQGLRMAKKEREQTQAKLEQALHKAANTRLHVRSEIRPAVEAAVLAGAGFATGHSVADIVMMMGPAGAALTEGLARDRKAAAECERLTRELEQCDKTYKEGLTALKKDLTTRGTIVAGAAALAAAVVFQKKRI